MEEKLPLKDKLGYALGDFAGQLGFALVGSYLSMFYTDVLGLQLSAIAVLMLLARVWDAANDPLWGTLIDRFPAQKGGKFRPWLLWFGIPLGATMVLSFLPVTGFSAGGRLAWAYGSYILFGMVYTGVNIPYGSLASVITGNPSERTSLSVWRSAGAGLGAIPASVLLPMLVYSTTAAGADYLDGKKLFLCVAGMAVLSAVLYTLSYTFTKERVPYLQTEKPQIAKTAKALLKNKPFLSLCAVSLLFIATTMYLNTMNGYVFKDYFKRPGLFGLYAVFTYLPMALLLPFAAKLCRRFGKKELCALGMAVAAAANLLLWVSRTASVGFYFVCLFFSGLGQAFFTLEVWAMAAEVIDWQSALSGQREEGTVFALYSFARKLGHTLAGTGGALLLSVCGYQVAEAGREAPIQTAQAVQNLYAAATGVPGAAFLLAFLLLTFLYPLGKKQLEAFYKDR
ncbi:MAG: glycoside-pentoside-hexuronide (GPH):cation symporter [Oscillospiraceae bacterium]|nr:glycoside-pentoside-hexuronide (GPH):cation symporter [Oscillospiraceae bacterium]